MPLVRRVVDILNHNSVVRVLKNFRNEIVDRSFRTNGRSAAEQLVSQLKLTKSKNICFAIAFNVPWSIEILIAAWRRYPTNLQLVIANNCSDDDKRREIKTLCRLYEFLI